MHPAGVWRFWTAEHPLYRVIPFDADDTACAAVVLRRHGGAPETVGRLLLANRDPRGLFYTWFVPHRAVAPLDLVYWRAAANALRAPVRRRAFWHLTEAAPADVDAVVNANVLHFLGETQATRPVVEYLIAVVHEGRDGDCDKWYRRPLAVQHAIARCYASGVSGLGAARRQAIAGILARGRPDGSFGDGPLDTALAVCALCDWGHDGLEVAAGAAALVRTQLAPGGWLAEAYYVGGPRGVVRWGSEALTTGFCVQALARAVAPRAAAPAPGG